ncbi:MAG TPA: cytochrome c biogenesis protein CcsA [Gemmatimonadaceae bacterium]|nr:cytochrome c biogenesis protein CcsA [Gemmatimonadaceae bacterium]
MIPVAHLLAIACYVSAACLAAAPFARPIAAPVRGVITLLAAGILAHLAGLAAYVRAFGVLPLTGLGPALSFAALVMAASLLVVEALAREVSLSLIAAPLAALATAFGLMAGLTPAHDPAAAGLWLESHVALSFVGIAAFATAAAAGAMYLVERRELRSRQFGAVFRFFPPLETLDRVNHVAAITGWLALTAGIALSAAYSFALRDADSLKLIWGTSAWLAVTAITAGRVVGGWSSRRAAVVSSILFAAIVVLYVAFRLADPEPGRFL